MLTYPIENSLTLICAVWNDLLCIFAIFNVSLLSNCSTFINSRKMFCSTSFSEKGPFINYVTQKGGGGGGGGRESGQL